MGDTSFPPFIIIWAISVSVTIHYSTVHSTNKVPLCFVFSAGGAVEVPAGNSAEG